MCTRKESIAQECARPDQRHIRRLGRRATVDHRIKRLGLRENLLVKRRGVVPHPNVAASLSAIGDVRYALMPIMLEDAETSAALGLERPGSARPSAADDRGVSLSARQSRRSRRTWFPTPNKNGLSLSRRASWEDGPQAPCLRGKYQQTPAGLAKTAASFPAQPRASTPSKRSD